jgi:Fibronectin type III domain
MLHKISLRKIMFTGFLLLLFLSQAGTVSARANDWAGNGHAGGTISALPLAPAPAAAALPGAFNKSAPAKAAANQTSSPTLKWGASSGATGYYYCIDTTNDNTCSTFVNNGTATSVTLSGLAANTTYYWQVGAVNNNGVTYANGSSTAFWSFTTGTLPGAFNKSAPANAAPGQSTYPTLSWGASSGATGYYYCYDTTNDNTCSTFVNNGTATSVTLVGLAANTTYYWQVGAVNNNGITYANGSSTAFWSFTTGTLPGTFNKSAPANTAPGQTAGPTLSWGASSGATGYYYCIDTTNDNSCSTLVNNGTATSVTLSGLAANTTYYWQVGAYNSVGPTYANGSFSAFWSFTTGTLPGAFNKSAPAKAATNQSTYPTLSWGASSGATGYYYCYDTSNDNACSTFVNNGTATSVTLSGLAANTTYYWQVKAVDNNGTTYANGSSTAFWSFKTGTLPGTFNKSAPANAAPGQTAGPTLRWSASSGATGYYYCIDTTNDNSCSTLVNNGTATSVTLSGLAANTTYYWQVGAYNSIGPTFANGSSTAFWSFTTQP